MYKLCILILCFHAQYGYLTNKFVPMMMDEDDSHHQINLPGYDAHHLNQFAYRISQRYKGDQYDKCDKYSSHYDPHHPDCITDRCDKTSINYMPNHPECANKCDPHSITYQPNHPDCGKCDPQSINFMPNNPDCPGPVVCPVPDPCDPECDVFDPCNQQCDNFDPCNEDCSSFDPCNENCASFDPCNEDCPCVGGGCPQCRPECPQSFDKCAPECPDFDKCDEDCDPDPCDDDCPGNDSKCTEGCDNFNPCDDDCTEADKSDCDDRVDPDPCVEDPTSAECQTEKPPKCKVMLSSINTTACQISEEFQAMTCGDCPDADIDIEELTDACRKPSADLIDCMATIGSMENDDGQICNMYEFKFLRSTMSPKCFKPKPKYPVYPRYEPRYRKRYIPYRSPLSYPKHYQAPKKLFIKPRKMAIIVRKRYV